MNTIAAIKQRHSCRDYSSKPVSRKAILELLELANLAPSAANRQNRCFLVVTDKKDRQFLADMNHQPHLAQAPVDLIVFTNPATFANPGDYLKAARDWDMHHWGATEHDFKGNKEFLRKYYAMTRTWPISDAAAAVENFLLAATEKGIGSCWVGVLDDEAIKKRFKIDKNLMTVCVVSLGYEKEAPKWHTNRKKIKELVRWAR
jgi:nitroreductase